LQSTIKVYSQMLNTI